MLEHFSQSMVDALRALGAAYEAGLAQVIMAASALYLGRLTEAGRHAWHPDYGSRWIKDASHHGHGF